MSQDTSSDAVCPVFEVHRVGNVNQAEASQLELSEIARKYTELLPITSIEQLQKAKALAIVPPENHMIVDKLKFKDVVQKNAEDLAAKKSEASVRRLEAAQKEIERRAATEIETVLSLIANVVQTEQSKLETAVEQVWTETESAGEAEKIEKRKTAVSSLLAQQNASLKHIFDLIIARRSALNHFEVDSEALEGENQEEGANE